MTRLSNRQFPMLQTFIDMGARQHMRIEEAQHFDQRPFRSMLIRKWVEFIPGRGFRITQLGVDAWNEFQTTEITRGEAYWNRPLTATFDPTQYGLAPRDWRGQKSKASVHVMSKKGAA